MKVLLDTNALIWWTINDARLGREATSIIADRSNTVLASSISLWEIAIKMRSGKLRFPLAKLPALLARNGFSTLDITMQHLQALADLPRHHKDPFDHLLIAQAMAEQALLMTSDVMIARYPVRTASCLS